MLLLFLASRIIATTPSFGVGFSFNRFFLLLQLRAVQNFVQFFKVGKISDCVHKFILFRTNPILYNNLYIFGLCARCRCFSIFALYRYGRGRSICSDFVFILFIFGNMIHKTQFLYNQRKKVQKSIVIKKKSLSLHCRNTTGQFY